MRQSGKSLAQAAQLGEHILDGPKTILIWRARECLKVTVERVNPSDKGDHPVIMETEGGELVGLPADRADSDPVHGRVRDYNSHWADRFVTPASAATPQGEQPPPGSSPGQAPQARTDGPDGPEDKQE